MEPHFLARMQQEVPALDKAKMLIPLVIIKCTAFVCD
jgi:hypothetical protein